MSDTLRPEGACSGCPYRQNCHAPRRQAMAALGEGRHTLCEFYKAFRDREPTPRQKNLSRIRIRSGWALGLARWIRGNRT